MRHLEADIAPSWSVAARPHQYVKPHDMLTCRAKSCHALAQRITPTVCTLQRHDFEKFRACWLQLGHHMGAPVSTLVRVSASEHLITAVAMLM